MTVDDQIHDRAQRPRRRPRGRLAVAVVLAVAAVAVGVVVAARKPDTGAAATVDPATVAYLPSFISDTSTDVAKRLDLTRTTRGYRLVATTTSGTYTVTFDRAKDPGGRTDRIGTSAAFAYGTIEKTTTSRRWSDAVGTVSVTVSESARTNLDRVAQSLILVDLDTYEAFLADPEAPVRSRPVRLVFGDTDVGTLRWDGELAGDGVMLRTTGRARASGSASLGVTGPTELASWRAGNGGYQLLRVPADFDRIAITEGRADIVGTLTDPTVGPVVLLRADTRQPVSYEVRFTSGRPAHPYSMCIECD